MALEEKLQYRHEYKYLVSAGELAVLKNRLEGLVERDVHASERGSYEIRSVYLDDYRNTCFYQNESGEDPRAKFRIRIYEASDRRITLEKKSKKNGMTHKESAELTKEQAEQILRGIPLSIDADRLSGYPPLLQQFAVLMYTKLLRPAVIVTYERVPFVCREGNVRITFDQNITSSVQFERFFEKDIREYPILPAGQHVLEVKYDEFLPSYLKKQLELGRLRQTNFSKYYLCRKYNEVN
ncbi:MAG: polyphosphate polymerase domain-containing protein [Lachnospiraceae bacterium]|nr:polyphosphate polymerase domain-containing protein [Lachnospiraceae bacterium]